MKRAFPKIDVVTTQSRGAPATGAETKVYLDGVELERLVGYTIEGRTNDVTKVTLTFIAEVSLSHLPPSPME